MRRPMPLQTTFGSGRMADTRRRRIPVWLELVLLLVLLALAAWGLRVGYIRYMRSAYPVEYEA